MLSSKPLFRVTRRGLAVAQTCAILDGAIHRVHALEADGILPQGATDHMRGRVDQGEDNCQTQ